MVRVKIANMHCGGCAKGVRATLSRMAPGVAADINLEVREVILDFQDEALVLATLRDDGWDAQAVPMLHAAPLTDTVCHPCAVR